MKTGYIGPANDQSTLWTTDGAVYYTTDGTDPAGSLGVASGTSTAVALAYDGIQQDASGNGNAAYWRGTMAGVLNGLPLGSEGRYKIGLWNTATMKRNLPTTKRRPITRFLKHVMDKQDMVDEFNYELRMWLFII